MSNPEHTLPTKLPEIKSDFALLDVKRGRRVGAWGKDDGTSQEFEIEVATVEVHPREGAER